MQNVLFHSVPDGIIYTQMSHAAEATGTLTTKCLKKNYMNRHIVGLLQMQFLYSVAYFHNLLRNAHFHKPVVDDMWSKEVLSCREFFFFNQLTFTRLML